MKEMYVLTSKVTGLVKQVYAQNALEAIQSIQSERKGFGIGQFTIRVQQRREMRS
jgi:hypothetical protein